MFLHFSIANFSLSKVYSASKPGTKDRNKKNWRKLEFLEKKLFQNLLKHSKKMADLYDAFRLKLFESMFDFVRKVVELAAVKNWKIESIHVGMPEIGINMTEVAGYRIPIPSIKGPPVSFVFKPV